MIVVADASPLIALADIGRLRLLADLYRSVTIPTAVRNEIIASPGIAGRLPPWLTVRGPDNTRLVSTLLGELDPGEAEAVALAIELQALLLIDEVAGRAAGQRLGLVVTGTLGVLIQAKREGLIQQVAPLLADLLTTGFWMSAPLRTEALRLAGEA